MRDYMVEMEDDGLAHLRFGFGEAGWQPAIVGAVLLATYRVGNGTVGNIGRDSLGHIVTEQQSLSVRNLLAAQGGSSPTRTDAARLHAPHSIKMWEPPASQAEGMPSEPSANQSANAGLFEPGTLDTLERCVTADDYAAVAIRHPRVAHAIAQMRWSGSWRTAVVFVQRRGDDDVSPEFRAELREFMEPFRMAGYDLDIQPPQFAPVQIELLVHLQPGHQVKVVGSALEAALGNRALDGGATGFFHPDNYTFGQPVHRSQLIARAMAVTGVAWVEVKQFRRMGSALDVEHIQPGPIEIARLDNDPRRPQNGILLLEFKDRR
jgi:hypothetical protein